MSFDAIKKFKVEGSPAALLIWFRKEWRALAVIVFGNIVSAFTVINFILPYRFPDLGVSGLAVLSNYVFGISPS